ncbi:PTS system sorbose-specific IIC component [Lactobacillus colini]|uniref:PTS system sorbose-specific IIC component n=1 Tax=Lactobacillus colini TaxID=1819254 RepID=A0ABS4MEV5_9LACO|nr:PTS mannose/fructose/sorbose transporter subunit IIC [Lactobacillus colini]MBP2058196.1 PTS system sorbose-specific IIC component [Lactobacillus colini]
MSAIQVVLITIWSSIVGAGSVLDEFQTQRPLIACSVMGLILGDPVKGLILGGTLELIALGWMNVGAAQSPDSALASTISTILVIIGNQSVTKGIAIALPVAAAGQVLTVLCRTITVAFQHASDKAVEKADFRMLEWLNFSSLIVQALRVAIPTAVVAIFVSPAMVQNALNALPKVVTGGLAVAGGFIVTVGYAMILNMMYVKYLMQFFYLGFVLSAYMKLSLLAWGVVGLVLALIYVQLDPKFNKNTQTPVITTKVEDLPEDELED